jgi:Arc/MetJ-type ribon-helix-helix transcriptional regulator
MAELNITIPDSLKAFVDSKVGSGRLKDASAYVQLLIEEAMEAQEIDFSAEQRERIDQMLLESAASYDRGDYAPLRPGELEEVVKRVMDQHQGKQAS